MSFNNPFIYKIPFTLSPQKDTFKIGIDTIWIEANFGSTLVDTNGIANTFENCDFKITLGASKIDIDPVTANTVEDFPAIVKIGKMTPKILPKADVSFYEVETTYEQGIYRFKTGLIPKTKGLFGIYIAPSTFRQLQCPLTNNCKNTAYVVYSGMNIGGKNNFNFFANSPVSYVREEKEISQLNGGGYAFYVK